MLAHLARPCDSAFSVVLLSSATMSSLIAKWQIGTRIDPIAGQSRSECSIPWYTSVLADKVLK